MNILKYCNILLSWPDDSLTPQLEMTEPSHNLNVLDSSDIRFLLQSNEFVIVKWAIKEG